MAISSKRFQISDKENIVKAVNFYTVKDNSVINQISRSAFGQRPDSLINTMLGQELKGMMPAIPKELNPMFRALGLSTNNLPMSLLKQVTGVNDIGQAAMDMASSLMGDMTDNSMIDSIASAFSGVKSIGDGVVSWADDIASDALDSFNDFTTAINSAYDNTVKRSIVNGFSYTSDMISGFYSDVLGQACDNELIGGLGKIISNTIQDPYIQSTVRRSVISKYGSDGRVLMDIASSVQRGRVDRIPDQIASSVLKGYKLPRSLKTYQSRPFYVLTTQSCSRLGIDIASGYMSEAMSSDFRKLTRQASHQKANRDNEISLLPGIIDIVLT